MLREAWRLQRDYFYDPTMHGVDWPQIYERYKVVLEDCTSREDVQYVIGEMISELNVGHTYARTGGDLEKPDSVSVGLLGADYELHDGAYRIAKIYEGAPWDVDARGPLSQPGVNIKEGEYLLAVNGVPLDATKDPWAAFQNLAGKTVAIKVSAQPKIDDRARELLVVPLASEAELRYRAWIERNRAYVAEKTGGRVGYLHVPDTGVNGQNELFRQFYGQTHSDGLIIDERWNGGGQVTVPTFAFYETDGTWGIEGHGVDPDIEVVDDPARMTGGRDPQLDAAIDHMLDELKRAPAARPKRPAYPNRAGMGIKPEDK